MTMLPLKGLKIVEFEGLGPGPLAGHMLAQAGAEVTLIARPTANALSAQLGAGSTPLREGKQLVLLDLKNAADVARALDLVAGADALIEGNRPGVMERLGLGPDVCHARNPKLVYGRMTGWGQTGPLANAAGHDLNYVALTGLLSLSARPGERPIIPPTVAGDGQSLWVVVLKPNRSSSRNCACHSNGRPARLSINPTVNKNAAIDHADSPKREANSPNVHGRIPLKSAVNSTTLLQAVSHW